MVESISTTIPVLSDPTLFAFLCCQICDFTPSANVGWIPEQKVPYATYASSWVGYDDKPSFSSKVTKSAITTCFSKNVIRQQIPILLICD